MAIDLGLVSLLAVSGGALAELVQILLPKWVWITTVVPVAIGMVISVVPVAYFFLSVAIAGRTVGKALMGVRVVGLKGGRLPPGRSLLRAFAYLVSLIPLAAGFLWVLVDRDRRAWHDHIAGSRVVYDSSVRRG